MAETEDRLRRRQAVLVAVLTAGYAGYYLCRSNLSVAMPLIGPYSYLAGAIALDFGGTKAAGSAAGVIDGIGYLGGVLAGDTVARIAVGAGWSGAFGFLAAVSGLGTLLAAHHLRTIRPGASARSARSARSA